MKDRQAIACLFLFSKDIKGNYTTKTPKRVFFVLNLDLLFFANFAINHLQDKAISSWH